MYDSRYGSMAFHQKSAVASPPIAPTIDADQPSNPNTISGKTAPNSAPLEP